MKMIARDLGVRIGPRTIFEDVNLNVPPGTMVALTGPSGCGKTTLLNCLGLIQRPTTGSVLADGIETNDWRDNQRTTFWRNHAAFIYQDYGVIEDQTVHYNVTLTKRQSKETRNRIEEILSRVGLARRGNELAAVLSGGEKQRLGVARAIYKKATVIFADEPTASLDSDNQELVTKLLRSCVDNGASVVIATHDSHLASACDTRFVMDEATNRH
ncbi:ATP-binding cassette domain-containing protein [Actinomycetaceae bacterium L2_0104]